MEPGRRPWCDPGCRSDLGTVRRVVEGIVVPATIPFVNVLEVLDELDAGDPLGHLVAELALDADPIGFP